MGKNDQSSRAVLMVRPTTFGFDEQTAKTNSFQKHVSLAQNDVLRRANDEFDAAVVKLRSAGITVLVFEDKDDQAKPNAVFPNNWVSTWPNGWVCTYPMATPSRRTERSPAALDMLGKAFEVKKLHDLSGAEQNHQYLEGTGVIIFDHLNKIAYACISPRCDETLFRKHVHDLGYQPVAFHAYDQKDKAIYHTNIMLGIQTTTAVVCAEAITDAGEHTQVMNTLIETGHQVVDITTEQMNHYCANVLELQNGKGERFLALSQGAYDNFTPAQRELLSKDKTLLPVALPTIEAVGGGSFRCLLAEVFLPRMTPS